jgi:hypothetical protein
MFRRKNYININRFSDETWTHLQWPVTPWFVPFALICSVQKIYDQIQEQRSFMNDQSFSKMPEGFEFLTSHIREIKDIYLALSESIIFFKEILTTKQNDDVVLSNMISFQQKFEYYNGKYLNSNSKVSPLVIEKLNTSFYPFHDLLTDIIKQSKEKLNKKPVKDTERGSLQQPVSSTVLILSSIAAHTDKQYSREIDRKEVASASEKDKCLHKNARFSHIAPSVVSAGKKRDSNNQFSSRQYANSTFIKDSYEKMQAETEEQYCTKLNK